MQVIFRVDAALHIGTGHIVRCLTLAEQLREQGATCSFICRDFAGNLNKLIQEKGYGLYVLPISSIDCQTDSQNLSYESWLGVPSDDDAKQTVAILESMNESIDWLIVDHYGIDLLWQTRLRAYTKKIMVIDDLANRQHDADLLVDQNLYHNYQRRYQNLLPKSCRALLGPAYALLRPEFAYYRSEPKQKNDHPQILVFFGGIDLAGETLKFLQAIRNQFTQYRFEVILGRQSPHFQTALSLVDQQNHITLWHGCDEMAKLMHQCDFAFGASGSTNWERFCLGLNAALVCVAENQRQLLDDLDSQDLVTQLIATGGGASYSLFLEQLDIFSCKLDERRIKIQALVDGQGIFKVIGEMRAIL